MFTRGTSNLWGGDENILYLDCGGGYTIHPVVKIPRTLNPQRVIILHINWTSSTLIFKDRKDRLQRMPPRTAK